MVQWIAEKLVRYLTGGVCWKSVLLHTRTYWVTREATGYCWKQELERLPSAGVKYSSICKQVQALVTWQKHRPVLSGSPGYTSPGQAKSWRKHLLAKHRRKLYSAGTYSDKTLQAEQQREKLILEEPSQKATRKRRKISSLCNVFPVPLAYKA